MRLNKIAKDFNVGIQTLVDFLEKKTGVTVEGPMANVTDEQYEMFRKEFNKDKALKEMRERERQYKLLENPQIIVESNSPDNRCSYRSVDAEHPHNSVERPYNAVQSSGSSLIPSIIEKTVKRVSAFQKLMNFAVFLQYNQAIQQLAEKALPENWYYGNQDPGGYPILKNYLQLTFERLQTEDSQSSDIPKCPKILCNGNYAVFNTGLVDKLYEPIYAFFNRNHKAKDTNDPKWFFLSFVGSQDEDRQTLTREFGSKLPDPAHYYNSTSELVYNVKSEIGSLNWNHFLDHLERFPEEFLQDYGPKFDWEQKHDLTFYKKLKEAILSDLRSFNRIKGRIEESIKFAQKRVMWNFKTAIPIYYPGQEQISLLLPLALCEEGKIDVALVLESTESGAYIAHTMLTLEMAYTNARLITRPDSDWLV